MKIIDLLNKIANDEISNKAKFKWKDSVIVNKKGTLYMNDMYFSRVLNLGNYGALNDEVEIIEDDEFEDIKELNLEKGSINDKTFLAKYITNNRYKINALIKNQKKIIEQLKNKD